ncbi:putative baseplate assembly protein [Halovivax limisalsi]|uniref:putative baseplate assembly protein n=1 Tax=Halovivax limisalsi TaxID=1453760 RepID=UPI001FFC6EEF|nr:putative baseplate assembly protein [Halovivax limisalsi]
MGIDVPDLDDRAYDDLLERAQKLVPAYSDTWTDFNPHDPGITILELLAWLTETHTYQLDQITDAHRRKHLQLLGKRPRRSRPAEATVQFRPPASAAGTRLPAGTRLAVTDETATRHRFETERDVVLTDAEIERALTVVDGEVTDHGDGTVPSFYRPFGRTADPSATFYLGFDGNPFAGADALTLSVSYHDENLPEPGGSTAAVPPFDPSVDLAWAYRSADGDWKSLSVRVDDTEAFYRSGLIELSPAGTDAGLDGRSEPAAISTERPWVRCRVRTGGWEVPPQVAGIRPNAVTVTNTIRVDAEPLRRIEASQERGASPVLDGQRFAFEHRPVRSATITVDGIEYGEVPDFDASGPDDRHYVLDRERGEITFGDGAAGRVPPPSATVRADYVAGGGADANVSGSATWQLVDDGCAIPGAASAASIPVRSLGPATGGRDPEPIDEAFRRVRRELREPARAVTESDYRRLVATTPGLRIGRTGVWVDRPDPLVVVVPHAPADVPTPTPSEPFLEAVRSRLRERTLITDRIRVRGPEYARLECTVRGTVRPQYAESGYEAAIEDAVSTFLHPLYGDDGTGWPFGQPLSKAALVDVIEGVDAVDHVDTLSITAHGAGTTGDGTIRLDDTALFTLEAVDVTMVRGRESR